MRAIQSAFVFVLLLAKTASSGADVPSREHPIRVSIVQLLANPGSYEGKLVTIRGYIHLEFEGNGVYLHKEDYEQGIHSNGFWLDATVCNHPDGATFDTGYALVTGRFTGRNQGHMGLWAGSIEEVRYCSSYPSSKPST